MEDHRIWWSSMLFSMRSSSSGVVFQASPQPALISPGKDVYKRQIWRLFGILTILGFFLSISLHVRTHTCIASLSLSMTIGIRTPPRTVHVIAFGYIDAKSNLLNTLFVVALEYPSPIPFPCVSGLKSKTHTVSYTHLDVYKRQTLYLSQTEAVQRVPFTVTRTMPQTAMQKCVQADAGISGKISQNRIPLLDIRKNSAPVSYTHL